MEQMSSIASPPMPQTSGPARLQTARKALAASRRKGPIGTGAIGNMAPIRLGLPAIDDALPGGGLTRGAVHEIAGAQPLDGAALGFAAFVLARLERSAGPVLWIRNPAGARARPYGHGLARLGLAPGRLLTARVRRAADAQWAAEEGLRCPALGAVVVEIETVGFTASRRLQLAAESTGVTALIIRPALPAADSPVAAATRWQVHAAPSPSPFGAVRWHLDLHRCRGGRPFSWLVEWCDETGDLALAADAGDRSSVPPAARLAG